MASTTGHTIVINGNPRGENRQFEDAIAASAITPGELIEFDSNGKLQAHSTAGGDAAKMVAVENPFADSTSAAAIDHDYAANETVRYILAKPGDILYMFLAAGENVSKGDLLESDGAGALQAHTAQAVDEGGTATYTIYLAAVVGQAYEDKDNSGGGSAVRIKVRVI